MKPTHRVLVLAALAVAAAVAALAGFVAITQAEPPSGVTATILARGTYDPFKTKTEPKSPIDFKARAQGPLDIIVRQHDYAAHSTTGWHTHPGPIFITVTQGQLTYYELDDPTCSPHVVTAGHGFVDDGLGHVVRNETDQPAQDISVITAPVGGVFRTNLAANANLHCGF